MSIIGLFGSEKSILMHLVGELDTPTLGSIVVEGKEISKLKVLLF